MKMDSSERKDLKQANKMVRSFKIFNIQFNIANIHLFNVNIYASLIVAILVSLGLYSFAVFVLSFFIFNKIEISYEKK